MKQHETLSKLRQRLVGLGDVDRESWGAVAAWIVAARAVVRVHYPEHLSDFEMIAGEPDWESLPWSYTPPYRGRPGRSNEAAAAGEERRENRSRAAVAVQQLLSLCDALLGLDPGGTGVAATTANFGTINNSVTNVINSQIGALASGPSSVAHSGAGGVQGSHALVALGPEILAWGDVVGTSIGVWHLHLASPFLAGDVAALAHFIDTFDDVPENERYIASQGLGDGRLVRAAPTWTRQGGGLLVEVPVKPRIPRIDASTVSDFGVLPDGDLDPTFSTMARGQEAVALLVPRLLSMCKGGWGIGADAGSRVAELRQAHGDAHLEAFIFVELVRLATVTSGPNEASSVMGYIDRVQSVTVATDSSDENRITARLQLRLHGIGELFDRTVTFPVSTYHLGLEPEFLCPEP